MTKYSKGKSALKRASEEEILRKETVLNFLKIQNLIHNGRDIDPVNCHTKFLLSMIRKAEKFKLNTELNDHQRANKPMEWE